MKTVSELDREFSTIKSKRIPRAEKLPLVRALLDDVTHIEKAAFNFSGGGISIAEIRAVKNFIHEVEQYLA